MLRFTLVWHLSLPVTFISLPQIIQRIQSPLFNGEGTKNDITLSARKRVNIKSQKEVTEKDFQGEN